jgi:hypothetical protein
MVQRYGRRQSGEGQSCRYEHNWNVQELRDERTLTPGPSPRGRGGKLIQKLTPSSLGEGGAKRRACARRRRSEGVAHLGSGPQVGEGAI